MRNEWIYECRNFRDLWDFLSPKERSEYLIDIAQSPMIRTTAMSRQLQF